MSSAIRFNLDQSKILSFGNGLNRNEALHKGTVSRNSTFLSTEGFNIQFSNVVYEFGNFIDRLTDVNNFIVAAYVDLDCKSIYRGCYHI